jgi:hypothetical protein
MQELIEYVMTATEVFRKGDIVKKSREGEVDVVIVDNFPERPEDRVTVDCHFITVGFTEAAPSWSHHQLFDYLLEHPVGEFTALTKSDWEGGPSYITIGGWIGSQELALRLMALGELHQLWRVITPARLGITGVAGDQLAGQGLVNTTGLHEPAEVK